MVYLRDISILKKMGKKSIADLTLREVYQHENFVDVKQLCVDRDIEERMPENIIHRSKRQQQPRQACSKKVEMAATGTIDPRTGSYNIAGPDDRTLQFDSRFESGNLFTAMKVEEQEYDLLM